MITQESPLFPVALEAIAKRIATDITREGALLPCCIGDPVLKLWRWDINGETLYIALRPERLQLSLAERSADEVKAAWDTYKSASNSYSSLRNRSEWCRGMDFEDIEDARERYQDAWKRFENARGETVGRWLRITQALTPLLEGVVRENVDCPMSLCTMYRPG